MSERTTGHTTEHATVPQPPAPPVREAWEQMIAPPPGAAFVYERPDRGGLLYVRRWEATTTGGKGEWRRGSLAPLAKAYAREHEDPTFVAKLVDAKGKRLTGRALRDRQAWAAKAAARLLAQWDATATGAAPDPAAAAPLVADAAPRPITLGETRALLTHPDTGKFPVRPGVNLSAHAREVLRSLDFAVRALGPDTAWADLEVDELTTLWRRRLLAAKEGGTTGRRAMAQHTGIRAAEIVIRDLAAIANWLRGGRRAGKDRPHVPAGAAVPPKDWRRQIQTDWVTLVGKEAGLVAPPEVQRDRHRHEDLQRVAAQAYSVDPRLGLLLDLGLVLRGGQVARLRRSDVDLAVGDHGRFVVPGSGTKKGAGVRLTAGERAALDAALGRTDPTRGYLRDLEAAYVAGTIRDYRLFPAGQLRGGRKGEDPRAVVARHAAAREVGSEALRAWWREAEEAAGVDPIPGVALRSGRRAGVDFAKQEKISREGLQALGGWKDTQVPDRIYADQEQAYAEEEAARVRARMRGEALVERAADGPGTPDRLPGDGRTDTEETAGHGPVTDPLA